MLSAATRLACALAILCNVLMLLRHSYDSLVKGLLRTFCSVLAAVAGAVELELKMRLFASLEVRCHRRRWCRNNRRLCRHMHV